MKVNVVAEKPISFEVPEEILKQFKETRIIAAKILIGIPIFEKMLTPASMETWKKAGLTPVLVPTASVEG